jgi:FMN phosphatase YigB (HAD superfamily)
MLDWSSVETVLLDLDGTLLDLHFDTYFWTEHLPLRYAERSGIGVAAPRPSWRQGSRRARDHWPGIASITGRES